MSILNQSIDLITLRKVVLCLSSFKFQHIDDLLHRFSISTDSLIDGFHSDQDITRLCRFHEFGTLFTRTRLNRPQYQFSSARDKVRALFPRSKFVL